MSMFNPEAYKPAVGVSKMFDPGLLFATIADVRLEQPSHLVAKNAYYVTLTLEGQDEGEDFEGFEKDKQDPGLGKYRGKIAQVRSGNWSFSDFTYNNKFISRDSQIFQFLGDLTLQMGKEEAVKQIFTQYMASKEPGYEVATIEEYLEVIKPGLVDDANFGQFTVVGEPYVNKNNNTSYSMMFPKKTGGKYPFAAAKTAEDQPKTLMQNVIYLLEPRAPKAGEAHPDANAEYTEPVAGFGGQQATPSPSASNGAAKASAQAETEPELDQLPF